jgi:hypothetical protein
VPIEVVQGAREQRGPDYDSEIPRREAARSTGSGTSIRDALQQMMRSPVGFPFTVWPFVGVKPSNSCVYVDHLDGTLRA